MKINRPYKDLTKERWMKYLDSLPMVFTSSDIDKVKELVRNTPNDQELGEKIRQLINKTN